MYEITYIYSYREREREKDLYMYLNLFQKGICPENMNKI